MSIALVKAFGKLSPNVGRIATGLQACLMTFAIGSSVLSGQKVGGISDFASGVADVTQEQYYSDGGTESGTLMGAIGNIANGGVTLLGTSLLRSEALRNKIGFNPKYCGYLKKAAPLMVLWQGAQFLKETKGDGDPLKDKCDMAGNVIGAAAWISAMGGKKGLKDLGLKSVRIIKDLVAKA